MRNFNGNNTNNKIRKNSFQTQKFPKIKSILNKQNFKIHKSAKKLGLPSLKTIKNMNAKNENSEELVLLSNANLNIINILNTCVSEDFNETSFFNNNNNSNYINNKHTEQKDMGKNKLYKNNNQSRYGKTKDLDLKKNKIKNNIRINKINLNTSYLGADSSNNKKRNIQSSDFSDYSFNSRRKSNFKKVYSEKELFTEGNKNLNLSKFNKYYSNLGNDTTSLKACNDSSNMSPKHRSVSNQKLRTLRLLDQSVASIHSNAKTMSNKKREKNHHLFGTFSDKEMMKLNQNITNEINLIQLKKKISQLKKKIKQKFSNKNIRKYKSDGEGSPIRSLRERKTNHPVEDSINNSKNLDNNYRSNKIKNASIRSNIHSEIKLVKTNEENKFRYIARKNCLYDSIDDEEYNDEIIDYYITPDSQFIRIFDIFIFISSMFSFIFVPYILSRNIFLSNEHNLYKVIMMIIDVFYIVDVIINFFRAYHTYDDHLIRRTRKIFFHYFKTWFFIDLIQAFPYFSFFNLLEKKQSNKYIQINPLFYILLMFKIIKLYKMINDNTTISYFYEILSKNEIIDNHGSVITTIILFLFFLNMTVCIFIFLGVNSYPSWIIKLNIQDEPYLKVYLISTYFIIVTITTVGYGDIKGESIPEISFQILLLIAGTIAYSFIISFFSNYIIKSNQKSMSYEKNVEILREIKINHPNMKKSIYQEALRTLKNEQIYERKDKHLLFDCLPYSLKNEMIMEMYKQIIKNFIFFKEVDNSDFIIKVATSLKPLIAVKGDILIQEGDFVKEIFFIKAGVIGLNICIDLDHLDSSIKKYFGKNEIGKFDITYLKSGIMNNRNNIKMTDIHNLDTFFVTKIEESDSNSESENICENIEYIRILEIRKNEHFGDALMFLNERSPLIAKVRTRNTELFILRKMEAIEIYSVYPNIWKRINKKSLYNMEQIYLKIKKLIIELSKRYNIKLHKSCIKKGNKKFLKGLKKKKVKFLSDVKKKNNNFITINEENESNKVESKDISEKDENTLSKKTSSQKNIIENKNEEIAIKNKNKENFRKPALRHITTFDQDKIKNEKDSIHEEAILSNEPSQFKIILKEACIDDDKENKKLIASKTLDQKNMKFTNSIVKNNSFKIICEKETLKSKEKKIKNQKDRSSINIQRQFFHIQGRTWTITKETDESLKANKSIKVDDSSNLKDISLKDDINKSAIEKNKKSLNSSFSKNEKLYYSSFINLCSTKENSLIFSSSYENINRISNNKYIYDISLQKKIKNIIIKELNSKDSDKSFRKKNTYQSRNLSTHAREIQLNSNNVKNKYSDTVIQKPLKHSSSLKKLGKKSRTIKRELSNDKSEKLLSVVKFENRRSMFAIRNSKKFKEGDTPNKLKRKLTKKKLVKVKKKLSVITENIKNTINAINNPNEFYMNFFNNIIKKETFDIPNDDKDKKKDQNLSNSSLYSQK